MFINNLTGKTIKDISFGGFWFSIPAGISLCWDEFAKHLFKNAYPETGAGVPPVIRASASQWKGDRYVDVRRFELNAALIPSRADLIKLAKKQGVPAATIEQWHEDETVGGDEMARIINELDVPEHIKFPVPGAEVPVHDDAEKAAEEVLNDTNKGTEGDPGKPAVGAMDGTKTGAAPSRAAAPKTGGKKSKDEKSTKVASRAPRTPRMPAAK